MTALAFIADGERDLRVLPALVRTILSRDVTTDPAHLRIWHGVRLNGSGFGRKLAFAILEAKQDGLDGVVATVDRDKARASERLAQLEDARVADRSRNPPFPVALGEAAPHGEAWLLDDAHAVKTGLRLSATTDVVSIAKSKDPKTDLEALIEASGIGTQDALESIAREVSHPRCPHAAATGFARFVEEVKRELGQ